MIDVVETHFSTIRLSSNLLHIQLLRGQTHVAQIHKGQACTKTVMLFNFLSEAARQQSSTM